VRRRGACAPSLRATTKEERWGGVSRDLVTRLGSVGLTLRTWVRAPTALHLSAAPKLNPFYYGWHY